MKIVIAGGGSGGHIFPGIAIAQALLSLDKTAEIFFIGAERGLERVLIPKAGYRVELLDIAGLNHVSFRQKFKTALLLPKAMVKAMSILKREQVDVVIGIGGYASGPVLLAAFLLKIPSAICEPNSVPGVTNRILGYLVKRVYGAFSYAAPYFPRHKWVLSGTPVRKELLSGVQKSAEAVVKEQGAFRLLILGGSQGARFLNESMPQVAGLLRQAGVQIELLHQTGKSDVEAVHKAYRQHGVLADVRPFIDDMPKAYAWADIAVCRSGAGTCTELTLMGVPSVLIPFPFAADDHQTLNARELEQAGAALLLHQKSHTPASIAAIIQRLAADSKERERMAQAARSLARPHAADMIAKDALSKFVEKN